MGLMDWLSDARDFNNDVSKNIRDGLFGFNQAFGQGVRDRLDPNKILANQANTPQNPSQWIGEVLRNGPGAASNPLMRDGAFSGRQGGSSPVTNASPGANANGSNIFSQVMGGMNNSMNNIGSALQGAATTVEDPTAGLRERLLAELGNKRSFEDLGLSAILDTSGIDSAHKQSQQQLAEALNRSVQGINKGRTTAKGNYGNASKEIQNYYNANVEDVRETKGAVQKDANQATNEMKANQAQIMQQLQASDAAMAQEAKLRGEGTGGPRGGESDILQQAQGDIAATNSEQINNSIAEKGRREGQVDRNALALQSEGGNQVGNIEALLASVLTGYDTRESDVRTANANASAGLGNQYAGQKMQAEQAQQQAVFNARNQFQQGEDQRGMSILQMLLGNDQAQQEAEFNQYSQQQEAEQKQMANAAKGDSKMQEMLFEQYFRSLAENDPKKLAELVQINSQ